MILNLEVSQANTVAGGITGVECYGNFTLGKREKCASAGMDVNILKVMANNINENSYLLVSCQGKMTALINGVSSGSCPSGEMIQLECYCHGDYCPCEGFVM